MTTSVVKYHGGFHSKHEVEKLFGTISTKKPFFALVARSNAGKSSLINALLMGNFAQVSSTPGKTKCAHLFEGPYYFLLDLPGYGWTRSGAFTAMEQVLANLLELTLPGTNKLRVLRLVDGYRALTFPKFVEKDEKMLKFLHSKQLEFTTVITKVDAMSNLELGKLRLLLPPEEYKFYTSSKKGHGLRDLHEFLKTTSCK